MKSSIEWWCIVVVAVCFAFSAESAPTAIPISSHSQTTWDVTKYGAVGDGSTDCTASVAAAVSAMLSVQTAGASLTLWFPPGTYMFKSPPAPQTQAYINITPGVGANPNISYSLVGGGSAATVLQCYSSCFHVTNVLSFSVSDISMLNPPESLMDASLNVEQVSTVSFDRVGLTQRGYNSLLTLTNVATATLTNFNATSTNASDISVVGSVVCESCGSFTMTDFFISLEDTSAVLSLFTIGVALGGRYSNSTLARGTISGFSAGISASGSPASSSSIQTDDARSLTILEVNFFDSVGAFYTDDPTATIFFQNCNFTAPDVRSHPPTGVQILFPKPVSASNLLPITVQDCSFSQMAVAAVVQNALFNLVGCTFLNISGATGAAIQYTTYTPPDAVSTGVNFIQSVLQNNVFKLVASSPVMINSPDDSFIQVNLSGNECIDTPSFDTTNCFTGGCIGSNNIGCGNLSNEISES